MRALSDTFLNALEHQDGLLHPILERVKKDQTLMIAIRHNYVNIYYRGGNILKITEQNERSYQSSFDDQYNNSAEDIRALPAIIKSQHEANIWVDSFPHLKKIMDFYFSEHCKPEREFQQLVARENNNSTISNESEYFISDIEVADTILGARFDMLAIRWLASERKNGSNCKAAFIEMKYGDDALGGSSGLLKHLQDIDNLIRNETRYEKLLRTMELQFNQLDRLRLLSFNRCINDTEIKLDSKNKPEVIFLLANHNPRSSKLKTILDDPHIAQYGQSTLFDLKFFVASFSGYGLHADCMIPLANFQQLLSFSKLGDSQMHQVPENILLAIQRHFHEVIRGRAAALIDKHNLVLPDLTLFLTAKESKTWFAVPGMCGGFSYWLEGEGVNTKLVTESWCRVVDGSGQRHEITATGSKLVDEGFV